MWAGVMLRMVAQCVVYEYGLSIVLLKNFRIFIDRRTSQNLAMEKSKLYRVDGCIDGWVERRHFWDSTYHGGRP